MGPSGKLLNLFYPNVIIIKKGSLSSYGDPTCFSFLLPPWVRAVPTQPQNHAPKRKEERKNFWSKWPWDYFLCNLCLKNKDWSFWGAVLLAFTGEEMVAGQIQSIQSSLEGSSSHLQVTSHRVQFKSTYHRICMRLAGWAAPQPRGCFTSIMPQRDVYAS